MAIYLSLALGGSVGAMLRYWVQSMAHHWFGDGFPYGTLIVNVTGSLLMGFLSVLVVSRFEVDESVRVGLLAGFLGSFTTFSTFALDVLHLSNDGALLKAAGYIVLSILFCILGVWAGLMAARQLI